MTARELFKIAKKNDLKPGLLNAILKQLGAK